MQTHIGKNSFMNLRNVPLRAATGAFILNSGVGKATGSREQAEGLHQTAAHAYPALKNLDATTFRTALATSEIALGTALLTPFVSDRLAGAALTAFSAGLIGLYLRTPAMRMPGSIRPSQDGIAVAKDSWMLGIGISLLAGRPTK